MRTWNTHLEWEGCLQSPLYFWYLGKMEREEERATSSNPIASVPMNGGQPPDINPGSPMWNMFQGYGLSGFDSFEILLILSI